MSARKRKPKPKALDRGADVRRRKSWSIEFFLRTAKQLSAPIPARDFLDGCPTEVRAELLATLQAVRDAPPPSFSGGLRWQAMHGDMKGWFEARTKRDKTLCRLFCLLDRDGPGLAGPSIILVTGGAKPNETAFSDQFYAEVRALGEEYKSSNPRSIAR